MHTQRQIDQLLAQRASEWVEVLRTADAAQRAAFIDWLSESKLHVQEFLEVVAVDRMLDRVDATHEEDVDQILKRISASVVPLINRDNATVARQPTKNPIKRWPWFGALAACLAIIGIVAQPLYTRLMGIQAFSTLVGEQRTIELPDASVIHLNADSEVEVRLSKTERNIRLLRGEALFKVAPDTHRPFRVHARTATVQALGTQFNVYDRPEGTRVSVLEGRVKVTATQRSDTGKPLRELPVLDAGKEVLVALNGTTAQNNRIDATRTTAWRQRRLIFDGTALEDMVREFNRYNRSVRIRLESIPPGSHHYDGIFDADDPGSLAELLSREKDVVVETREKEIVIRSRS